MTQIRAVKTKPITRKQVKDGMSHCNLKEQKEITLKALEGIPDNWLTPKLLKLRQSTKPVVMGNLSVIDNNPINREKQIKTMIARIRTISTTNLTQGKQITKAYVAMAARIEEREENKIDEELTKKAQNSKQIKWDHHTVTLQQAKLKKLTKKDPELGQQKLKTYKQEQQEVAHNEGRLPQNSEATFKPSDLLEKQEANALYIPMHA